MNDYQRIKKVIDEQNFRSSRELALKLGVKPQIFYDIKSGKCGVSEEIATKIHDMFLNYSIAWLMGIEGEMLKDDASEPVAEPTLGDLARMIADHDRRFHDQMERIMDAMGIEKAEKKEKTA